MGSPLEAWKDLEQAISGPPKLERNEIVDELDLKIFGNAEWRGICKGNWTRPVTGFPKVYKKLCLIFP